MRAAARLSNSLKSSIVRIPAAAPLAEALWWLADHRPARRTVKPATIPERRFADSLSRWLVDLGSAAPVVPMPPPRRVMVFTSVQRLVEMSTAVAVVLAHRNCDVDLVFVPRYWNRQVGSPSRWDRAIYERLVWRPLRAIRHPRLRAFSLDGVPEAEIPANVVEAMRGQARIDVMYIRRRESVYVDGTDAPLFRQRVARDVATARRVCTLLSAANYDTVLIGNGLVLEAGAVYRAVLRSAALPVTFEAWDKEQAIVASQGKPWSSYDLSDRWNAVDPHAPDAARAERVEALMASRAGRTVTAKGVTYQENAPEEPAVTRERLHIRPGVPVVLVCTNVFWDSIYLSMNKHPFPSMREWLVRSVRHLSGRTDCAVIVQPHPLERMSSSAETLEDIVLHAGLGDAPNVRILHPREFNTYSLMALADLGVVYASTTGLEMAMRGIPVLCGNVYHYSGKGFTMEPATESDYFGLMERVLADPAAYRLSRREIELARSYADLFFNELTRPFPWTLTKFRNDELLDSEHPMAEVLSAGGQRRYGPIFDYLAGR